MFIQKNPTNILEAVFQKRHCYNCSFSTGLKEMQNTLFHCTALIHDIIREHTTTICQKLGLSACASCWRVSRTSETHCSTRAGGSTDFLNLFTLHKCADFPKCVTFQCRPLSFLGLNRFRYNRIRMHLSL